MDIIDELFGLFACYGDRDYGEDVTQTEHALQAAHFARATAKIARLTLSMAVCAWPRASSDHACSTSIVRDCGGQ